MRWKKHRAEEIAAKLEAIRLTVANGQALSSAIKAAGISEATYFRWRSQFGALDAAHVAQIKRLEQENARLRRALAELEISAAA